MHVFVLYIPWIDKRQECDAHFTQMAELLCVKHEEENAVGRWIVNGGLKKEMSFEVFFRYFGQSIDILKYQFTNV